MRVELTDPAADDFLQIVLFIAADNPDRALSFTRELEASCFALEDFPKRGPVLKERNGYEIRRLVHGSYVVLYQIEEASISVLRIIHGSQDMETIL
ncbi:MAG: type II toxin-antitoxin system RelE/ParE family toxin [Hyphomicrobiaceae bacterium]|nr:type II toxin-antitoxin system RelE/ParE family toxin [Hyphomicrobiaceae bacterium]